jgi:hypothetical protein
MTAAAATAAITNTFLAGAALSLLVRREQRRRHWVGGSVPAAFQVLICERADLQPLLASVGELDVEVVAVLFNA